MLPVHDILEQARRARDPRFDGRFFIGVRTTGIYCRPVCPVKMPKRENVAFFATAAAASEAGFRPCLRCRPEASPGTPAWMGTSTTVARALKLIDGGALDEGSMPDLADRLGVTARHLNRLFRKHLGASAKTIAQTRRLQFAKQLIDETSLPMTAVAMSAGYGSIRRFNDHFRHTYQRAPASLRRGSMSGATDGEAVQLKLAYRTPYDFAGMLDFLRVRSIPGLEEVTGNVWRRVVGTGDRPGRISVRDAPEDSALLLAACGVAPRELMSVANRVRKMFDLDAVPA
ncbi:MAG: bifunctional transcriptional activator/DNA repair enzyme AdaA, partial [Pseudomonadales bacterium]